MEPAQQKRAPVETPESTPVATIGTAPDVTGDAVNDPVYQQPAANNPFYNAPPHTQTQSTLAPTAEFTRIFLLAWIIRYIFRGASGTIFKELEQGTGIRTAILNFISKPGRWLHGRIFPATIHAGDKAKQFEQMEAAAYAATVGLGSAWLTHSYNKLVHRDIQNIFSEAVALEKNKSYKDVTFNDIKHSSNGIVQRTMDNHRSKARSRFGTDALFLGAAALRHAGLTDMLLGIKGIQIFADTWKRKTTMFEDLVTFINNKINPRNGLGQAIATGDIFDLYQHYTEEFHPDRMFTNVLEHGTGEGARWAQTQPIFERISNLMNLTYAYKHSPKIDPKTGHAIHQADFALPKFIYLLGHDLIDVQKPQQTLMTIEVANRFGIGAVKEMHAMIAQGASLTAVATRFPIPPGPTTQTPKAEEKSGLRTMGSTMQVDKAEVPLTSIATDSIAREQALADAPGVTV